MQERVDISQSLLT